MTHDIQDQAGLEQEEFQAVLRAAGETETTQENIQDWLELDFSFWQSKKLLP
jgi:predicted DsbA family dithiol-disulfide isomerase